MSVTCDPQGLATTCGNPNGNLTRTLPSPRPSQAGGEGTFGRLVGTTQGQARSGSQDGVTRFAGADPDGVGDLGHKDLAVTHLARLGSRDDGVQRLC
jgi:hypothetical protein